MKSCRLTITGRVQGVFFRQNTLEKARELGISGYVKNRPDGTVYAEARGEDEALERFVQWCHQGPLLARVDKVTVVEAKIGEYHDFEIRPTD